MDQGNMHRAGWRRLRTLLAGLLLARGVVWLCVLPPFEAWDEYQHLAYIVHLDEHATRPHYGATLVPTAFLKRVVAFPHAEPVVETQLGEAGAVGYRRFWAGHDPTAPGAEAPRFREGASVLLYQAQHAPLYYRLVLPLYRGLGGLANLPRVVGGLRALNLLLTVAAALIAVEWLRRSFRSIRVAGLVGLVLATHPMFLLNGTRVASDALGASLATAVVALALGLARARSSRGIVAGWGLLGTLLGLATLAKASNLALLPFVGLAWMVRARRDGESRRRAGLGLVLLGLGFLAVAQGEIRHNLARHGSLTGMQEAVLNRAAGRTTSDLLAAARGRDWLTSTRRLWVRDLFFRGGWSDLRSFPAAIKAYQLATTVGLAGAAVVMLVWASRRRPRSWRPTFADVLSPVAFVTIVGGYSLGLAYHSLQSLLAWGEVATNPWYACPAFPWFLALVVAGGQALPRAGAAVPVAMAGASLAIEFVAIVGTMSYAYSGGATGALAWRRLAWYQPAPLGTATLLVAAVSVPILTAALLLAIRDLGRGLPAPRGVEPGAVTRQGLAFGTTPVTLPGAARVSRGPGPCGEAASP